MISRVKPRTVPVSSVRRATVAVPVASLTAVVLSPPSSTNPIRSMAQLTVAARLLLTYSYVREVLFYSDIHAINVPSKITISESLSSLHQDLAPATAVSRRSYRSASATIPAVLVQGLGSAIVSGLAKKQLGPVQLSSNMQYVRAQLAVPTATSIAGTLALVITSGAYLVPVGQIDMAVQAVFCRAAVVDIRDSVVPLATRITRNEGDII